MAVVNTKATAVTNADATPPTANSMKLAGGRIKSFVGVIEAANGDSVGSVYRFARVHTSWRIDRVLLSCDAITTCAGDVGVYDIASTNSGAVIDADFFASAQSLASALVHQDVTHEADAADAGSGYGLADCEKTLGAALGLTTDKWVDIAVTLTAAAGSGGTIVGKVNAIDNN